MCHLSEEGGKIKVGGPPQLSKSLLDVSAAISPPPEPVTEPERHWGGRETCVLPLILLLLVEERGGAAAAAHDSDPKGQQEPRRTS